ncbi:MAG: Sec-independent protein translocase TatB [Corynebacterium sp.]|nr:Sec-independent protein translocase TatB [Corynebacterium sp.]MDO5032014.1 Sec-independent protein translocase TatB [Corynebacterium sp.]
MFSSIGWPEIAMIVLLGIVVIGPERLPGVITDIRAAIYAARKAINNAKAELNGEMSQFSGEFEALRGPISQAAEWGRLGPKGAITKALFDGDDSAWDDFDPRTITKDMGNPTLAGQQPQAQSQSQPQRSVRPQPGHPGAQSTPAPGTVQQPGQPSQQTQGGFDYSQIYSQPAEPQRSEPRAEELAAQEQAQQKPAQQEPAAPDAQTRSESSGSEDTGGFSWTSVL